MRGCGRRSRSDSGIDLKVNRPQVERFRVETWMFTAISRRRCDSQRCLKANKTTFFLQRLFCQSWAFVGARGSGQEILGMANSDAAQLVYRNFAFSNLPMTRQFREFGPDFLPFSRQSDSRSQGFSRFHRQSIIGRGMGRLGFIVRR